MGVVALDFETVRFRQGLRAPPPVSLAWCAAGPGGEVSRGIAHCRLDSARALFEIEHDLNAAATGAWTVVFANAPFDLAVVCAEWPALVPLVFEALDAGGISDVIVRQKLLDVALGELRGAEGPDGKWRPHGYGLDDLALRLLGKTLPKDDEVRLTFGDLIDTPIDEWPEAYRTYAEGDPQTTLDVWAKQRDMIELDNSDVLADEAAQVRADFALQLISCWGLRTDPEGVERLRKSCQVRLDGLRDLLLREGLVTRQGKRNTRAAQDRVARVLAAAGRKVPLTAGGAKAIAQGLQVEIKHVRTDEETCRDSGDAALAAYADYQTTSSLLDGHVAAMAEGVTYPIHSRFEVLLETGRTSSSNPNVQNVRRAEGARECFAPRPGWCFVDADYGKLELHTLSQVCLWTVGRSRLAEALRGGLDPHLALGGQIAGLSYADALAAYNAGDQQVAEWRQRAKPANFGYPGGMGADSFRAYARANYNAEIDSATADALRDGFFASWPEVADYHGWIKTTLGPAGEGTIRHFVSGRYRGRVWFTVGANSLFQGLAADLAKRWAWLVARACYVEGVDPRLYGCRTVNFVHDELLVEVPIGREHEAAQAIEELAGEAGRSYCPDVPPSASAVACDRWSKKAKRKIGADGRLSIWHYAAPPVAA